MRGVFAIVCRLALVAVIMVTGVGRAIAAEPTDPGALGGLSGVIEYRLGAPAPAGDGGSAWRIEALDLSVDFDAGRVDLGEFLLVRESDGSEASFTGDNQFDQTLDLVNNSLSVLGGSAAGGFNVMGRFVGANGAGIETDFTVNLGNTQVTPVDLLLLSAEGVIADPFADVLVQRNAGRPEPAVREGEAVHAGTGNLFRAEVDVPVARPGGLHFTRYYNSRSPLAGDTGWLHSYASFIDFTVAGVERGVLMVRPDGEGLLFHRTASGALARSPAEIPAGVPAVGTAQYPLEPVAGRGEWRFRNENGGLEYYDADGRLLRIVDRNGLTQTVARDAAGRITAVTDAFGRALGFAHDDDGRLTAVRDPAGRRVEYAHDADGRLVGVTRQDGTTRSYHYGESGAPETALTGVTDERGIRLATWTYDAGNRVVAGERAGGAGRVELVYTDGGDTTVTTAAGAERTYGFERIAGRQLASSLTGDICDDCGKAAAQTYNDLGLPLRVTDPRGTATTRVYNDAGLETQRTEAVGTAVERITTTDWDVDRRLPVAIEAAGLRTEYTYDDRGRLLTTTRIDTVTDDARMTTRRYHSDGAVPGRLASIHGPRNDLEDVTRFAYDPQGNRVTTTNALGHVTEFTAHDDFGRVLREVSANGLVTSREYDARGRLVARNVGGELTRHEYDAAGNRKLLERPDGSRLAHEYDDAGRLEAVEDEDGNRIEYSLDAAGNRVAERVLDGYGGVVRSRQREFDALGRSTRIIGASGQATTHDYDANGNRIVTVSPDADRTTRTFDALDREATLTDPLGGITRTAHDAADRVVAVTDPRGNTTRFMYNGFGDRTGIDSPDSGLARFEHDAAGNVNERTDAEGRRSEFVHDALDRRVRGEHGDEIMVEYTYDEGVNGIGRLSSVEESGPGDWRSSIEWSRDLHGRVTERRESIHGRSLATRHVYDPQGRRTRTVHPSGTAVDYAWHTDTVIGVKAGGEAVVSGVVREPFGPLSGWVWGDGDTHDRSFDGDGRLTGQTLADGTRRIEYYSDGTIVRITGPRLDRGYEYDGLDRLATASDAARLDRYAHDSSGNRISRALGDRNETYTMADDSNRLLSIAGPRNINLAYDGTGNIVDDGEHRYGYSARNRLVAVDEGKTASYRYNALGERIFKAAQQDIDFLALAEAAEARADALAAEAGELGKQARAAQAEADAARDRAAQARADRGRAWARLEQAEAEARWHRWIGDSWQDIADRFSEQAERLRARIADPPRSWWDYLRNLLLKPLVALYEYLAERYQAWADARFALAEAADERATQAQIDVARAEARLAEAEAEIATAERSARDLLAQATAKQQQAAEQRRRAAEFRRLAQEGATRRTASRFVHGPDGELLARHAGDGAPVREYVHLDGVPIAVIGNGALHYIHADHRDTPRLVSRPGGAVVWSWISAPFGDTAPVTDPDGDDVPYDLNLRFPGQYFDAETGWHAAGTRVYDPTLGRFTAAGIVQRSAVNPWPFAGNDPVSEGTESPFTRR